MDAIEFLTNHWISLLFGLAALGCLIRIFSMVEIKLMPGKNGETLTSTATLFVIFAVVVVLLENLPMPWPIIAIIGLVVMYGLNLPEPTKKESHATTAPTET